MFNIKQFVNRITDNRNDRDGVGENSAAFVDHEEQHSAEGFLCPPCMKAFPSAEALEEHYNKTHVEEVSTPDTSANVDVVELLRQEIQTLQFSLADEKASSAELKKEMLKIQADLNAKDTDTASLRSQEKDLEESKTLLTSEVTLLRQQFAESLEQISMLRKEKDTVSHAASLAASENEELKKEVASLQAQLTHKNSIDDAEVLRQELVSVQKMMNQLTLEKENEIDLLKNKLNEILEPQETSEKYEKELDQALNELKILKETMKVNQSEQSEQIKKLTEELSSKEARLAELESLLHSKEKKSDMLEQECNQLKAECDRLREQHTELYQKIETGEGTKAALDSLQRENELLKKNLDEVQSQNKELSRQLHEAQLQVEKSLTDHKQLVTSMEAQTQELKEMEKSNLDLNATITDKDKMIDDMITKHKKIKAAADDNASQLKSLKESMKKKVEEIESLAREKKTLFDKEKLQHNKICLQNDEIVALQIKLKEVEESFLESDGNLQRREIDLKEAHEKISQLQESLAASRTEIKQTVENFENEVKSLTATIIEKQAAVEEKSSELNSVKQSLQEELTNLRNRNLSLDSEIKESKNELNRACQTISELTELHNDATQKLQLLQSKIDEMIQQKLELEQTCAKNEEEKSQLLEKLITSETEAKALNSTIDDISRKKDDAMAALQELGRENQSLQIEMAKIQGRKWADDSNVSNCSTCRKEFTLTVRKHHCRHCGQIFCSECSSKSASVPSSKKPVRVCDPCYTKLTSQ